MLSAKPTLTKRDPAVLATTEQFQSSRQPTRVIARSAEKELLQLRGLLSKLTRIFMSLKQQLRYASVGIPELHSTIFGSAEHPLAVWRKRDTENKVLRNSRSVSITFINFR